MAKATQQKVGLPVSVTDIMASQVAAAKTRIHAPTGQWIKVEGKEFVLPDGRRMTQLDAIIIDFICANNFYTQDYVEGEQNSPTCFALSFDADGMVPSKSIATPCHSDCTACPNKIWGSHRNGRGGKACDDNRNYVVMEIVAGEPKLYLMKASKTAVKPFDAYVNMLANTPTIDRPLCGVLTRISFDPTSKYPSQRWSFLSIASDNDVILATGQLEEARRMLSVEPSLTKPEDKPAVPAPKGKGRK